VAQLHRPLARTAPTVAGLYSCLWVFFGRAPCPSPAPASPNPPFPQKFHATPSRYPPPSQANQRWPTSGCNRRWITRLRESQHQVVLQAGAPVSMSSTRSATTCRSPLARRSNGFLSSSSALGIRNHFKKPSLGTTARRRATRSKKERSS